MSRNIIPVDQVVSNFIIMMEQDDYCSNVSDTVVRTLALRGIRELGFDTLKRVKSLRMPVNQNNSTVQLPDDFVDLCKIGYVGNDGLVYVFGENKNINYSMIYADPLADSNQDGVYNRVDDKGTVTSIPTLLSGQESFLFRNYLYENTYGALYGLGGGHYSGEYRMNLEQNRIELFPSNGSDEVVIEYVADEARSYNPSVHTYAEPALNAYIYYHLVERKATVPMNEKMRARQEYYNEKRLANARLSSFSKEEALKTIRKNFKQSPKY
jgi:hypothetical protein